MAITNNTQIHELLSETATNKDRTHAELSVIFKFLADYVSSVKHQNGTRLFRAAAVSIVRDMLIDIDTDAVLYLDNEIEAWLRPAGDTDLFADIEDLVSLIKPSINIDECRLDEFVNAWDELAINEHDDAANNAAISVSINLHQSINRH
jgi:hypothetical protein